MTVNELIELLQSVAAQGKGDYTLVYDSLTIGDEFISDLDILNDEQQVRLS